MSETPFRHIPQPVTGRIRIPIKWIEGGVMFVTIRTNEMTPMRYHLHLKSGSRLSSAATQACDAPETFTSIPGRWTI